MQLAFDVMNTIRNWSEKLLGETLMHKGLKRLTFLFHLISAISSMFNHAGQSCWGQSRCWVCSSGGGDQRMGASGGFSCLLQVDVLRVRSLLDLTEAVCLEQGCLVKGFVGVWEAWGRPPSFEKWCWDAGTSLGEGGTEGWSGWKTSKQGPRTAFALAWNPWGSERGARRDGWVGAGRRERCAGGAGQGAGCRASGPSCCSCVKFGETCWAPALLWRLKHRSHRSLGLFGISILSFSRNVWKHFCCSCEEHPLSNITVLNPYCESDLPFRGVYVRHFFPRHRVLPQALPRFVVRGLS